MCTIFVFIKFWDQLQTVHLRAPTYIKINYESNFQALQGVWNFLRIKLEFKVDRCHKNSFSCQFAKLAEGTNCIYISWRDLFLSTIATLIMLRGNLPSFQFPFFLACKCNWSLPLPAKTVARKEKAPFCFLFWMKIILELEITNSAERVYELNMYCIQIPIHHKRTRNYVNPYKTWCSLIFQNGG